MENNKRIEFIDLAKGICITLVVLHHCHIETPYLVYVRMPLYFILSGLFFKTYDGLWDFTKRKINKILIPFVFFYSISFGLYVLLSIVAPEVRINSEVERFCFDDPWFSRLCFNNPLWFLLSLFWCNLLFYLVQLVTKRIWLQALIAIGFAIAYYSIKDTGITLPLYFSNSLRYYLFFFMGSILRKTNLLYKTQGESFIERNKDWMMGMGCLALFICLANVDISIEIISIIRRYCISILGVLALLLLIKRFKYVPIISYFGRYSIVILCTSYLVYSPLRIIIPRLISISPIATNYMAFFVTMFAEYFIIAVCIKYLPHVTAQKDLIPVGTTRND